MLKTSMRDYEKFTMVTYPFYFINRQSMHKTNCMQSFENISMWEEFSSICYNIFIVTIYKYVVILMYS